MIHIDDLKSFKAIVDHGSLSRAAAALRVTQPSLSYALKKMETRLGVDLFVRSSKGLFLTESGSVFDHKVDQLLNNWENLTSLVGNEPLHSKKKIKIGCHPAVAKYTLHRFLPIVLRELPSLRIEIKHGLSRDINSMVNDGVIDLALVINPILHPDLVIKKISTDLVKLFQKNSSKKHHILIYDPNLSQSQWLLRELNRKKIYFSQWIESSDLGVISNLITEGVGAGILPTRALTEPLMVYPGADDILFEDQLCLVYRTESKKEITIKKINKIIQKKLI